MRRWPLALFALLLGLNLAGVRAACNWDIVGYVGASHAFAGLSRDEAHRRTYASVLTRCAGAGIVDPANAYRAAIAADAEAFEQQLPFYAVKPVYPWLMRLASELGASPAGASVAISTIAYVGIAIVVLVWLRPFLGWPWAAVGAWLIVSLPFLLELAELSTPDALSTLVVLWALHELLVSGRAVTAMAILAASVAVRPDNLIWLAVAGGYVLVSRPRSRTAAAAATAAALGAALHWWIAAWAGSFGWRIQFHHQFVERLTHPAELVPPLGIGGYAWIYLRESHPANLPWYLLPLVLVGIATAAIRAALVRRDGTPSPLVGTVDPWIRILGLVGIYMACRWLLYPDEDRLFAAAYTMILIAAACTLHETRARLAEAVKPQGMP